jgi:O-Antigen ligase
MLARSATALAAGAIPAALAFRSGGYFPSEWGVELLVLGLIALIAVLLRERPTIARLEAAVLAGLLGLAVWTLASTAWSPGADQPVLASELTLVYVAGAGAALLALSRERVQALLLGVTGGITVVGLYALETRLIEGRMGSVTDVLSGSRLVEPIGYANALGSIAAIGLVLALAFALTGANAPIRALCASALVPLAVVLYVTLSRASYLVLAVGLIVFVAVGRSRAVAGGLLIVAPWPLVAILLAERSPLTQAGLDVARAREAGHRLAWELAALALVSGAGGALTARLAPRLVRWAIGACAVCAGVVIALLVAAGPVRIADRALDRLREPPPATGSNLDRRVLSVSGSGRTAYWRVAVRMVERQPLVGEGGGSFERWWLQERPIANDARNAHSLYLETLAELGPLGLALLLLALGTPLVAIRRCRRDPLAVAAGAAYAAWLVHAGLDWDWQIPAITLAALACGCAVLVRARRETTREPLAGVRRSLWLAAIVPLLVVGLVMNVGNRAADGAQRAIVRGDDVRAVAEARRARAWQPWAAQPWQLLGEAESARHDDARARESLHTSLDRNPASWITWYDLVSVTVGHERADAVRRAKALNPLAPELTGLH